MKPDLITGATGFIGGSLATRLLSMARPIRVLCRPESVGKLSPELRARAEVTLGDLRDRSSLVSAVEGVSKVFHCAGHVLDWGAEESFLSANVRGTGWLLDEARRAGVERVVHLSSIAVFGVPAPSYFDDESPVRPGRDPYSRSKAAGEELVLKYHRNTGLPVTVLRPAVVYGPRGSWLEEPLRLIEKNRMFLIGGGEGTCHPCFIDNLLDAMLLVSEHPLAVGRAYIVGDDEPVSFHEYFNYLARVAGRSEIRRSIPLSVAQTLASFLEASARWRPNQNRPLVTHAAIHMVTTQSQMSMRRIREELGYQPRFSVGAAMAVLKRWYEQKGKVVSVA